MFTFTNSQGLGGCLPFLTPLKNCNWCHQASLALVPFSTFEELYQTNQVSYMMPSTDLPSDHKCFMLTFKHSF